MNNLIHQKEWTDMHTEFLEFFASKLKPDLYIELGLYKAETIRRVSKYSKRSIGIDIEQRWPDYNECFEFYKMTTEEFIPELSMQNLSIDMMFIDADHSHEQSLKDFDNFFPFVKEDGFIFLHDTYPLNESYLNKNLCGDSYKTAWHIRQRYKDKCEIVTFPFQPGLSVVRKCTKQMIWI